MKSSGIGGQAVLEGVMMKNKSRYSVAVRTPDGKISTKTGECKSVADRNTFFRLPVIRGVVNFVESLVLGMQTLTYSSSFYEEEEIANREKEKKLQKAENKDSKETIENIIVVVVAIILALGIFMLLPFFLSELLRSRVHSQTTLALLEGLLRIVLFLGYVIAISFLGDIKRVFMYHGAEHKTINCVENGMELTVENVRKQSKHHRRCGTSFLLIVMFVSIIFFLFIHIENIWLRMLFRILLIPVIAGVSYEFIRLAGNTDNKVVLILSKPGMLLQRLTTREPEDSMIEVAIASVEAVFDWKAYQQQMASETKALEEEASTEKPPKEKRDRGRKAASAVEEKEPAVSAAEKDSAAEEKEPAAPVAEKDSVTEEEKKPAVSAAEKDRTAEKKKPVVSRSEKETDTSDAELDVEEEQLPIFWQHVMSGLGEKMDFVSGKLFRTRARKKKELAEREMEYHKRAMERARRLKEQAEREAERERKYKAIEKRRAERIAARNNSMPAPKVETENEGDELKSLDHYFDE